MKKWRRIDLSEEEVKELEKIENTVTDVRLLKRIQCIKLKNEGKKHKEIGKFLKRSIHTITHWIKQYKEGGIHSLLTWNCKGRQSKLSKKALEKLKKRDKEKPFDTAKEAKKFIEEEFGIEFHLHWVQKILKKNRLILQENKINSG